MINDIVPQIHTWFKAQHTTLCCAESLTAGQVQAALCAESGASQFFQGGLTAYETAIKVKLLGVDATHARSVNAVSAQVATEMAFGACRLFGAVWGMATTGYAEPAPARGIAVPYAYIAIVRADQPKALWQERLEAPSSLSRVEMQRYVTEEILQRLLQVLPRD